MPEYDVKESIALAKELGFDGIEWRVADAIPAEKPKEYTFERRYWTYNKSTVDIATIEENAAQIKGMCDEAGLEVFGLTTYLAPDKIEDIERVMKACNIMKCKTMRVFPPMYNETENYRVLFDRVVEETKAVEQLAKKYDIRVNFEIHHGNIMPSASAAYRFVSNFDPKYVGIIFDPGNMVHEGYENYKLGLELLGEYLGHVHVKNTGWEQEGADEDGTALWKSSWVPYQKGVANLKKLFRVLKEMNYDGYVSIEDFSNEEETYDKLKGDLAFVRKLSRD